MRKPYQIQRSIEPCRPTSCSSSDGSRTRHGKCQNIHIKQTFSIWNFTPKCINDDNTKFAQKNALTLKHKLTVIILKQQCPFTFCIKPFYPKVHNFDLIYHYFCHQLSDFTHIIVLNSVWNCILMDLKQHLQHFSYLVQSVPVLTLSLSKPHFKFSFQSTRFIVGLEIAFSVCLCVCAVIQFWNRIQENLMLKFLNCSMLLSRDFWSKTVFKIRQIKRVK